MDIFETGQRNFIGYGRQRPVIEWPNKAKIVISLVVNYEEGAERSFQDGDSISEGGDFRYPMPDGVRDLAAESSVEYGSRVGVWRLLDLFERHQVKATFFVCGRALERNPELGPALAEFGHEPCSHGYRWSEHFSMTEEEERQEINNAVASIERLVGERPVGWYCRYASSQRTRRLLVEEGGFIYDSDAYNDDLPYYVRVLDRPWLVVPYAADANDGRYLSSPGWSNSNQFYDYLVSSFDQLYEEGSQVRSILSVGLHCRLSGRPGRARAVDRFIAYAKSHDDVWFARRDEIARFWLEHYPPIE